jgi:hypothetical protein
MSVDPFASRMPRCAWLLYAAVLPAAAQQPLPQPDLDITTTGWVHAMARQSDGSVIIGGDFVLVNGVRRRNLARIRADGTLDPQWNPEPDGIVVDALAVDANDDVYVAGSFARIGGQARRNLAKLDGHGRGDADLAWDSGSGGGVMQLVVDDAHDRLYAGGSFDEIGGAARGGHSALHKTPPASATPWNPAPDGTVTALQVAGDWAVVAGNFTRIVGQPRRGLARVRLDAVNTLDAWNPIDATPAAFASIAACAPDALYVYGSFEQGGQRHLLAKLDPVSGLVDPEWQPEILDLERDLVSIACGDGDAVLLAGSFDRVGGEHRLSVAARGEASAGELLRDGFED